VLSEKCYTAVCHPLLLKDVCACPAAETDLLVAASTCPQGDVSVACGTGRAPTCYPLGVQVRGMGRVPAHVNLLHHLSCILLAPLWIFVTQLAVGLHWHHIQAITAPLHSLVGNVLLCVGAAGVSAIC
jgi:hypothetical protein